MRRRLRALVLLLPFVPLLLTTPSQAQSPPDRKAALERLRAAAGGRIETRWTKDHGAIRTLAGHLAPARAGTSEDVARTFLMEARDLFTLSADLGDLKLRGARSSPSGTHVGFDQTYAGLPVFDGGLDVHLDLAGSVYLVQNAYAPRLDSTMAASATAPRISAAAAVAAARRHFLTTWQPGPDKSGRPSSASRVRPRHPKAGDPELGILAGGDLAGGDTAGSLAPGAAPALVYRFELYAED